MKKNKIFISIIIIFSYLYSQSQNGRIFIVVKNSTKQEIAFPFLNYNQGIYYFSYNQSNDTLYIKCKLKDSIIEKDSNQGWSGFTCTTLEPKHKFKFSLYFENGNNINTIVIYISNMRNYIIYFKRKHNKYVSMKIVHLE